MSRRYCVIKENQKMRTLLSIIKSNYKSDSKDSLQEVNLEHVLNRVFNKNIKKLIKSAWKDLETIAGEEVRLLENNCKKSFINRLYKKSKDMCFIVKVKAENYNLDLFPKTLSSNLKFEDRYINI